MRNDERFRKDERIRRRREYLVVQRQGRKIHLPHLVAFVLPTATAGRVGITASRIGITVSRKVGGAVCRNRVRRRLREAWRKQRGKPQGWLVVLVAKRRASEAKFVALAAEVEQLGRRLGEMGGTRREAEVGRNP